MNAIAEEIKAAVRAVVREEVRAAFAEWSPANDDRDDALINIDEAARWLAAGAGYRLW